MAMTQQQPIPFASTVDRIVQELRSRRGNMVHDGEFHRLTVYQK